MRYALYLRLSKDDEKAGESASIERQRVILSEYVSSAGGEIAGEYADDGYSGTNFNRPALKKLLSDAQKRKFDAVLVKDLSRFGRNYLEVGRFVDEVFPALNVRFIALSDNVDTADRFSAAMDMMPIMNVFNEWHAANTGKKIRAVFRASAKAGRFLSWSYPYGYKAGEDAMRSAVIDEEAAKVVRKIFDLRLCGNSAQAIARVLNAAGVPNPASHYIKKDGGKSARSGSPLWSPRTVRRILSDPVYLGTTVQHKNERISYKNRKIVPVPEGDWIIKEHAHEAIVSEQVFQSVQQSFCSFRGRSDKTGVLHPLSGLLVCEDCGKKLKRKTGRNGRAFFVCRTHVELGGSCCSAHKIYEAALEELVRSDLARLASDLKFGEEELKALFKKECGRAQAECTPSFRKQAIKKRLREIETLEKAAFEDKVLRNLSEEEFQTLLKGYRAEKEALHAEQKSLETTPCVEEETKWKRFESAFRRTLSCGTLTREMCLKLISRVTVGETDENGVQRVKIQYRFSAPLP